MGGRASKDGQANMPQEEVRGRAVYRVFVQAARRVWQGQSCRYACLPACVGLEHETWDRVCGGGNMRMCTCVDASWHTCAHTYTHKCRSTCSLSSSRMLSFAHFDGQYKTAHIACVVPQPRTVCVQHINAYKLGLPKAHMSPLLKSRD